MFRSIFVDCYFEMIVSVSRAVCRQDAIACIPHLPSKYYEDDAGILFELLARSYRNQVRAKRDAVFPNRSKSKHYLHLDLYPFFAVLSWLEAIPEEIVYYTLSTLENIPSLNNVDVRKLQISLMRMILRRTIFAWVSFDEKDYTDCKDVIDDMILRLDSLFRRNLFIRAGQFILSETAQKELQSQLMELCRVLKRNNADRPMMEH